MDLLAQIKSSTVVHLCLAISFFTSGVLINIVQCILFYGLKPFNKVLYRRIGYYLCYSFYSRKYPHSFVNAATKARHLFLLIVWNNVFSPPFVHRNGIYCRLVVKLEAVYLLWWWDPEKVFGQRACTTADESYVWHWLADRMDVVRTIQRIGQL